MLYRSNYWWNIPHVGHSPRIIIVTIKPGLLNYFTKFNRFQYFYTLLPMGVHKCYVQDLKKVTSYVVMTEAQLIFAVSRSIKPRRFGPPGVKNVFNESLMLSSK